jgi:hypothetical protein
MSRNTILLIYHRDKFIDLISVRSFFCLFYDLNEMVYWEMEFSIAVTEC